MKCRPTAALVSRPFGRAGADGVSVKVLARLVVNAMLAQFQSCHIVIDIQSIIENIWNHSQSTPFYYRLPCSYFDPLLEFYRFI